MRHLCWSFAIAVLTLAPSISVTAQTAAGNIHAYSGSSCTSDQPLYADRNGNPIWLDTDSLLKNATHCTAPTIPPLARVARIEGYVSVDILVNDEGKVWCVWLVSGHPMLAGSALNAAKDWTFRPIKQKGKAVRFDGHLRFHFSTGEIKKDENPCTVVHW